MLKIYPVLCRAGKMDNYAYILQDETSKITAIIDPSEPEPIIQKLQKLKLEPSYILNTHHHYDHTDGNLAIKQRYGAKVVANINDSSRIPGFDIGVTPGEGFSLGESHAEIIDVSAHTQGHILWYFPEDKAVFTGDTLFNLCVGGLFEGSADEMYAALSKIKSLPDDVEFYPGHEYTLGGADFANYVNNGNEDIQKYLHRAVERLQGGQPVCPVTLGVEKKCNPYLKPNSLSEFKRLF